MRALILAGGSGTRFWPSSRRTRPKQLLALDGDRSLLRATVDRLHGLIEPGDVWISTTRALAESVGRELADVPPSQILAEPAARNTAPALGWAMTEMPGGAGSDVVAVLPADHRVADEEAFRRALGRAAEAADHGERVVTLGVEPTRPETGYGYLELAEELEGPAGLRRVARFREKPDLGSAQAMATSGRHLWNAGIFVFQREAMREHIARLAPDLGEGLAAMARSPERADELYGALPSISIDFAVMERLEDIAALPLSCGWSDLGSWEALAELLGASGGNSAVRGDVVEVEGAENLLIGDGGLVATLGVSGLVVVHAGDAVLVLPKERSQEVRRLVEALREAGRDELL